VSTIYRKTFKGIDEVAFKTTGLPLRMMSYLIAVDGQSSVDQLAARNPQLPSLQAVLQGLQEQGFLEVAGVAANVVDIAGARVGNGAPTQSYSQPAPPAQPMPQYQPSAPPSSGYGLQQSHSPELEMIKSNMIRDVSSVLGADAAPVIVKIQACRTKEDVFSTMMGIKKIIAIYADRNTADKFGARYNNL
jgi:hypothetical protein